VKAKSKKRVTVSISKETKEFLDSIKHTGQSEGEETLEGGASPPSYPHSPLPFVREGGQGDRLLNNLRYRT